MAQLPFWKRYFLAPFIAFLYKLWTRSWRLTVIEDPEFKKALTSGTVVLAHWHGDELVLISLVGRYRVATMTSTSQDGSLVDSVIHRLGGVTSRGSSTRGGVGALKGLIRLCKKGRNASMAVDGPKGPIYQVKPGVLEVSHILQAPIAPMGVYAPHSILFPRSWNKTFMPRPFSRVTVFFGFPIGPIQKSDLRKVETLQSVGKIIDEARRLAQENHDPSNSSNNAAGKSQDL